jgi:hypothetical protein
MVGRYRLIGSSAIAKILAWHIWPAANSQQPVAKVQSSRNLRRLQGRLVYCQNGDKIAVRNPRSSRMSL